MPSRLLLLLFAYFIAPMDAFSQTLSATQPSTLTAHTLRLRPGQDLKQALDAWVTDHRVEAGAMLTCVGSLTEVSLRLANQNEPTHYTGHFEIVSLVGTLSVNGSHLHLSVSDSTGRTLGGHLMGGNRVYTTAEIVIGVLPAVRFVREPDPTFGYRELVVQPAEPPKKPAH
jgi:uncharacterized protein